MVLLGGAAVVAMSQHEATQPFGGEQEEPPTTQAIEGGGLMPSAGASSSSSTDEGAGVGEQRVVIESFVGKCVQRVKDNDAFFDTVDWSRRKRRQRLFVDVDVVELAVAMHGNTVLRMVRLDHNRGVTDASMGALKVGLRKSRVVVCSLYDTGVSDEEQRVVKEICEANAKAAATSTGLPTGWVERTSRSTGKPYFYNAESGESTFKRPVASVGHAVVPVMNSDRLAEMKRLNNMVARIDSVVDATCEVCKQKCGSLARHQMRVRHGKIWEARQDESKSAKKRRLTRERGERKQRKLALMHEIQTPATLAMHEVIFESGHLELYMARLPKHMQTQLRDRHPLCNVGNNKP